MQLVVQAARLEQLLDVGHFLGDRGCACTDLVWCQQDFFLSHLTEEEKNSLKHTQKKSTYRNKAKVDVAVGRRRELGVVSGRHVVVVVVVLVSGGGCQASGLLGCDGWLDERRRLQRPGRDREAAGERGLISDTARHNHVERVLRSRRGNSAVQHPRDAMDRWMDGWVVGSRGCSARPKKTLVLTIVYSSYYWEVTHHLFI